MLKNKNLIAAIIQIIVCIIAIIYSIKTNNTAAQIIAITSMMSSISNGYSFIRLIKNKCLMMLDSSNYKYIIIYCMSTLMLTLTFKGISNILQKDEMTTDEMNTFIFFAIAMLGVIIITLKNIKDDLTLTEYVIEYNRINADIEYIRKIYPDNQPYSIYRDANKKEIFEDIILSKYSDEGVICDIDNKTIEINNKRYKDDIVISYLKTHNIKMKDLKDDDFEILDMLAIT